MVAAGSLERNRIEAARTINPAAVSQTANNIADQAALQGVDLGSLPVSALPLGVRLANFALRRSTRMSQAEMDEFVRMGIAPADLARLRELAQFAPDRLNGAVRAIVGGLTADQLLMDRTGPAPTE
jgi:hypothetical protein